MDKSSEYDNFDRTMRELMKVPRSEIKKKLDEEKEAGCPALPLFGTRVLVFAFSKLRDGSFLQLLVFLTR